MRSFGLENRKFNLNTTLFVHIILFTSHYITYSNYLYIFTHNKLFLCICLRIKNILLTLKQIDQFHILTNKICIINLKF